MYPPMSHQWMSRVVSTHCHRRMADQTEHDHGDLDDCPHSQPAFAPLQDPFLLLASSFFSFRFLHLYFDLHVLKAARAMLDMVRFPMSLAVVKSYSWDSSCDRAKLKGEYQKLHKETLRLENHVDHNDMDPLPQVDRSNLPESMVDVVDEHHDRNPQTKLV